MLKPILLILITIASLSCSDNNNSDPVNECGDGETVVVNDQLMCIFRQTIIETGFQCPVDGQIAYDVGDIVVCCEELPSGWISEVRQRYPEETKDIDLQCVAVVCELSETCSSGTCIDKCDAACTDGTALPTGCECPMDDLCQAACTNGTDLPAGCDPC